MTSAWRSQQAASVHAADQAGVVQVITAAEFHPQQCNTFAYSSSKGAVRMVDMRSGALLEGRTKPFVCQEQLVSGCPGGCGCPCFSA